MAAERGGLVACYGHLTRERSTDGRAWWFTHDGHRKAWQLLSRLSQDGTLFAYVSYGNARTTSPLEGGINSGIRTVLRQRRGMSEAHMKRSAEWFLYLHEIPIDRAHELIPTKRPELALANDETIQGTTEPDYYDTGLSAEEGYWVRSGWAGRA